MKSNKGAELVGQIPAYFNNFLKNGADFNAIGNYASPTIFRFKPPIGEQQVVARLLWAGVGDSEITGAKYVDLAELSVGVRVVKLDKNDKVILDLTKSRTIINNAVWSLYAFDFAIEVFGASPSNKDFWARIRWSFFKAGIPGIRLDGDREESFAVILNDDFSDLDFHTFQIQGYHETEWQ